MAELFDQNSQMNSEIDTERPTASLTSRSEYLYEDFGEPHRSGPEDALDGESRSSNSQWSLDNVELEECSESGDLDKLAFSRGKSVRFHKVEIREYGVILGDHPLTKSGPPVTIDWEHQANTNLELDAYEKSFVRRRNLSELRMPVAARRNLLRNEFTLNEMKQAERMSSIYRRIPESAFQLMWSSAVRKLEKWRKRRSRVTPEPAELWLQNYKQEQMSKAGDPT